MIFGVLWYDEYRWHSSIGDLHNVAEECENAIKIEKQGAKRPQFIDVLSTKSHKRGLAGAFESFVRSFQSFGFIIVFLPVVVVALACMGTAVSPALFVFDWICRSVVSFPLWAQGRCQGLGLLWAFSLRSLAHLHCPYRQ